MTTNYKNEVVTYKVDGSITTLGEDFVKVEEADGSSETSFNSGVLFVVDADGTTREYKPDDTAIITYPDGTVEIIEDSPPVVDDPVDTGTTDPATGTTDPATGGSGGEITNDGG